MEKVKFTIKLEKPAVRNMMLIALHNRYGNGQQTHKSRNQRRQTKSSWKKEQW